MKRSNRDELFRSVDSLSRKNANPRTRRIRFISLARWVVLVSSLTLCLSSCELVSWFLDQLGLFGNASQGLVAYYSLDGNAIDESGMLNHGVIHGAVAAANSTGIQGCAMEFDGVDDYVAIAPSPSLEFDQAISISAWFNLHSFSSSYPPIVKTSDSNQMNGYSLECHSNPEDWDGSYIGPSIFFMIDAGGGGLSETSGPVAISLGEWHHAVGIYDGFTARLFIDGVLQNSHTCSGTLTTSSNDLELGRDPSNTDRYFDGLMDQVRIYNKALTEEEVAYLYQGRQ
jgi:hypothetical protein